VAYLDQLSADSPLLAAPTPASWTSDRYAREMCPVVQLPGVAVALESVVRPGLLKRIAYARRRATRLGSFRIGEADRDSLASILSALFELHALRWCEHGEAGVFAEPRVQQFHRTAAAELLDAGFLRCYAMILDERIAGVYYGFHAHRRAYAYIGGFDPALHSLSIGNLLIAQALGDALAECSVEFDFLRGAEAYKYDWGAQDTPTFGRRLVPCDLAPP
jgi:CelD/BcsL family acetyltransferase involved in cellulose biosynthesis